MQRVKIVRPSAKAIIRDGKRFLAIKEILDGKGIWDIPGGKIEYGDSPEETLHREVKEEVGLDIEIEKLEGYYWFIGTGSFRHSQIVALAFLCRPKHTRIDLSKNPAVGEDIVEATWLTPQEFSTKQYTASEQLKKLLLGVV